ncbi:hypothetical protein TL16_g02539 [Triparma laevis f. inornata]|uniref:C2 domain-containing protein n=1 Tax=Triparma laevis f. inornata TaxID=1714386 RepID=A0A9W6ZNU7_9STRA|nr:hypothetical protein TL16_g02539 [Triparma laevis f. inornata]
MGDALFEQRMSNSLDNFAQLTRDFTVEPASIIKTSVETVTECMLFAKSIEVYEVRPKLNEKQRTFRRSLRRSLDKKKSRKERRSAGKDAITGGTGRRAGGISKAMAITAALEMKAMQAKMEAKKTTKASGLDAALEKMGNNKEKEAELEKPLIGAIHKRARWGGSVLIEYGWDDGPSLEVKDVFPKVVDAINTNFSEPTAYEVASKKEFMVCKFRDYDPQKDEDEIDELPYYVVVIERQQQALWPEDEIFLKRLAKIAQETFDCVRGREHRKKARKFALEAIKDISHKWKTMSIPDMIGVSIEEMAVPLKNTDIYAGLLEPGGHIINYVGASKESCMLGKRLKRGKGVSFGAIDAGKMVVVRNESAAKATGAHFFIDPRIQGWPYVCLPMKRGKLIRGILAVDSFDNAGKGRSDEEHPEKGVPEFLHQVGEFLGAAVDMKTKREALNRLESVTKNTNCTVEHVYRAALECLRSNIAFAQDVSVLEISGGYPLPYGKDAGGSTIDLTEGGKVTLSITEAKGLGKADLIGTSDPFVEVEFNGKVIGKTKTRQNTCNPFWANENFELEMENGDKRKLVLRLYDEDDNEKSEFLGLAEFSADELQIFKHNEKVVKALEVDVFLSREKNKLVQGELSLVFLASSDAEEEEESEDEFEGRDDRIDVVIQILAASDLAKADTFGSSDPIAILTFANKEVGRTNIINDNTNPVWNKKFQFSILSSQRRKKMEVRIYDMDTLGLGEFLGQVEIDGGEIMFPNPDTVSKNLEKNPSLGKKGNKLVQGSMKYKIMRQFSEASARRWDLLRKQMKVAARDHFKADLIADPHNVTKMVKMGLLCSQTTQGGTVNMVRCAAVLFQIAIDKGHSGDGKFWKSYAECHMRTWLAEGISAERLHLEKSCDGYDEALKFLKNATNVEVWVQSAYLSQLLGRTERAAQTLNTIIKSFPHYHDIARISLQAAMILSHLHRYEQALKHLQHCIDKGGANPYSSRDLMFYIARIHEVWGKEEAMEDILKVGMDTYAEVWQEKFKRGDAKEKTCEQWLANPEVWKEYGDKCSVAGHFFFTADMYKECISRLGDNYKAAHTLHFGLAKARYRCGNVGKAIKSLKEALKLKPDSAQLQHTLNSWKHPKMHLSEDVALPIPTLLGVYLDGQTHPNRKNIHLRRVLTSKRPSKPVELEKAVSIKSIPWHKLRYHVQAAARQFYKLKILEEGQGNDPQAIATLGCLCFDKSFMAKGHLMRACAIFLKRAHNAWESQDVDEVEFEESRRHLRLTSTSSQDGSEGSNNGVTEAVAAAREAAERQNQKDGGIAMHYASKNSYPYNKKLAQSLFRAWLNDGMHAERDMLVESMHATKEALQHIESTIDVEVWMQLARCQQFLGMNAASIITLKQIIQRFPNNPKLIATTELTMAMVYKMLKQYSLASDLLKECVTHAKQGLLVYTELDVMFILSRVYELWQEMDSTKAVIAQMGYQTVLERLQDEGEEDFKESISEWLSSGATWQKYAMKCTSAGDFGFGRDLYRQAFNREKVATHHHTLWYGYAKCQFMVGDITNATKSMEQALELDPGNEKYSTALGYLTNPVETFKNEIECPIEEVIKTYLESDSVEEVRIARELVRVELAKINKPRWKHIRLNIRGLARRHYATTEMVNMKEGNGIKIARMGLLCVEQAHLKVGMHYASVILMQKGEDFGLHLDEVGELNLGRFYRCLAEAHIRIWILQGVRAKQIHLEKAAEAWDKALVFFENAVNFDLWQKCAAVHNFLGDRKRAAAVLGYMVKSFPHHKEIGTCFLRATAVLVKLELWKESAAYMNAVTQLDYVALYDKLDLMFIMATIFDKWGESEGQHMKKSIADAAFTKIYEKMAEEGIAPPGGAKLWITKSQTWACAAEKSMNAGIFIFASMFFEKAIDLCRGEASQMNAWAGSIDPRDTQRRGRLCYMMGKCLLRIGEEKEGDVYLKEAIACGVVGSSVAPSQKMFDYSGTERKILPMESIGDPEKPGSPVTGASPQPIMRAVTTGVNEFFKESEEELKAKKDAEEPHFLKAHKKLDGLFGDETGYTENDDSGHFKNRHKNLTSMFGEDTDYDVEKGSFGGSHTGGGSHKKNLTNFFGEDAAAIVESSFKAKNSKFSKNAKGEEDTREEVSHEDLELMKIKASRDFSTDLNKEVDVILNEFAHMTDLDKPLTVLPSEDIQHDKEKADDKTGRNRNTRANKSFFKAVRIAKLSIAKPGGIEKQRSNSLDVHRRARGHGGSIDYSDVDSSEIDSKDGDDEMKELGVDQELLQQAEAEEIEADMKQERNKRPTVGFKDVERQERKTPKFLTKASKEATRRFEDGEKKLAYFPDGSGGKLDTRKTLSDIKLDNEEEEDDKTTDKNNVKLEWAKTEKEEEEEEEGEVKAEEEKKPIDLKRDDSKVLGGMLSAAVSPDKETGELKSLITQNASIIGKVLNEASEESNDAPIIMRSGGSKLSLLLHQTSEKDDDGKALNVIYNHPDMLKTGSQQRFTILQARSNGEPEESEEKKQENASPEKEKVEEKVEEKEPLEPKASLSDLLTAAADEDEQLQQQEEEKTDTATPLLEPKSSLSDSLTAATDEDEQTKEEEEIKEPTLPQSPSRPSPINTSSYRERANTLTKNNSMNSVLSSLDEDTPTHIPDSAMPSAIMMEEHHAQTNPSNLDSMSFNIMNSLQDHHTMKEFGLSADFGAEAEETFEHTITGFVATKSFGKKSRAIGKLAAMKGIVSTVKGVEAPGVVASPDKDNRPDSPERATTPGTSLQLLLNQSSTMTSEEEKPSIWIIMRKNIRAAAREFYRTELAEDPRNVDMIIRMGYLCSDSSSNASLGLTRASAVLLQRAANYGHDGDGRFWKTLAMQHLKAYELGGLRSERLHLIKARSAFDIALTHIENAVNADTHFAYATTTLYLGNHERALKAFESIKSNFRTHNDIPKVNLQAAMIKAARNEHRDAATMLHECIASKKHFPYTKGDMMVLVARVHEQWGFILDDKFQTKIAKDTYFRAFDISKEADPTIKGKLTDWLGSPYTFLSIAEKAMTANNFLFAADMYQQAIIRMKNVAKVKSVVASKLDADLNFRNGLAAKMHFGLAKASCKSGNMAHAIESLTKALTFDPVNDQMLGLLDAWENPQQRLEQDITMPTEQLLDNYLTSTLQSLNSLSTPAPIRREVTLDICACADLKKADMFGQSDPFVIVTFAGKEVYRTKVVKDNCNPTFSGERVSFVLPENLAGVSLILEVFDEDSMGVGSFLGMVKLPASTLLDAPPALEKVWKDLTQNSELKKKANKLVGGKIAIKWAVYNSVYDDAVVEGAGAGGEGADQQKRTTPRVVLRIQNLSAVKLGQADKFGLSDPICVIKYNGEEIGRTTAKDNTLSPNWQGENFLFTLPTEDIKEGKPLEELVIEVWDHDVVGVGEFLGQVAWNGDFYMHLPPGIMAFPLERKEGMPVLEQSLVQGLLRASLFLDGGDYGNLIDGRDTDGFRKFFVYVLCAYGLAKADSFGRSSDPYAVLKWGDSVVGKTEVIGNNLDPKWKNGAFEVLMLDKEVGDEGGGDFGGEKKLVIEVWDHDTLGSGSFLGGFEVDKDTFLYPTGKKNEVELKALESVLGDLDDEKVMRKLKLVQGSLVFKVETVESKGMAGISSHNGTNENIDCWSLMGGTCDLEKNVFDISASRNKPAMDRTQMNQVLSSRGSGKRGITLHGNPETVIAPFFDTGVNIWGRLVGPEMGTLHALQVVRLPGYDWKEDVSFAAMVAAEVEKAVRCIRGREFRAVARKNALIKVKRLCSDWAKIDVVVMMREVLAILMTILPRSNLYMGLLQPGGSSIRNSVVSPKSQMLGKEILRKDSNGVSFSMIGKGARDSIVCVKDLTTQKIVVAKENDIVKRHTTFSYFEDARGDDDEEKLTPKMLGNRANHEWPFLSVPFLHNDCSVGVVGVDGWAYVGKGRTDEGKVENGVLDFLKKVGKEMGTAVDKKRKLTALGELEKIVDNVFVTAEEIYLETLKVIANNVLTSSAAEIWHLKNDWSLAVLASIACNSVGQVGAIYEHGLYLKIEHGKKLGKADDYGESDPFCKIFWNNKQIGTTKAINNSCNPVWDEKHLLHAPARGSAMELRVEVWDSDFASQGDFLGQIILKEPVLLRPPKESLSMKLTTKEGLSKKANKLVKGKIIVKLESVGGDEKFRNLEFSVLDCHRLAKADLWGLSDPVVLIKWDGEEVNRTKVVEDSCDPVFGEHFSVKIPEIFEEESQFLSLEVYDQDMMGLGDFLGRVVIRGKDLLNPPENKRIEYELEGVDELGDKFNKLVKGTMRLHFGTEKDIKPKYFRKIVVEECRGLAKADMIGKSDPLVIVYYDNNEIFRTKSIQDTLDPLFLEHNKGVVGLPETVFEDRLLVFKVFDEDVGGKLGDFLGMCSINCRELTDSVNEDDNDGNPQGRRSFELVKDEAKSDRYNSLVKGSLTFRVIVPGSVDAGARTPVRVCVKAAYELQKADTFGKSDPYAIVEFAGRVVGKTRYMSSTLNPQWNESKFVVWVPPDVTEDELLKVKVFDRDMVGSHEFLGLTVVTGEHMVGKENVDQFGKISKRSLRPDSTVHLKDYNKLVKGFVEMGFTIDDGSENAIDMGSFDASGIARLREGEIGLRMNILSASGLGKADTFGKSDPFVIVRVDGEGWYESKAVNDTMDPVFGDEVTVFPLNRISKVEEEQKLKEKEDRQKAKEKEMLLAEVAAKKGVAPGSIKGAVAAPLSKSEEEEKEEEERKGKEQTRARSGSILKEKSSYVPGEDGFTSPTQRKNSIKFGEKKDAKEDDDANFIEASKSFTGGLLLQATDQNQEELVEKTKSFTGDLLIAAADKQEEEKPARKKEEEFKEVKKDDSDDDSDDGRVEGMPENWGKEKLILEIWDMDIAGKGDFLGRIGIDLDRLKDPSFYNTPQTFPLGRCPELPDSYMKCVKEGSTITCRFSPTDFETEREPKKKMFMHVIEAFGLAKADRFGNSDPFAIVNLNRKKILKTKVINDVITPLWDEKVSIELPRNEEDLTEIEIDVYDADGLWQGDFLGCLKLQAKDLLKFKNGIMEFDLQKREELGKSKNKLVQGKILLAFTEYVEEESKGLLGDVGKALGGLFGKKAEGEGEGRGRRRLRSTRTRRS